MAEARKILSQTAPTATVLTDSYTVPASTETVVSSITVCNRATTSSYFHVSVAPSGAADSVEQYMYYDVEIVGRDTMSAQVGLTLSQGDVIRVRSSTNNLSFHFYGVEIT